MSDPVDVGELRARAKSIMRRSAKSCQSLLQAGALRLSLDTGDVRCGDRPIRLTEKEFALLELLVRRRDQPVAKQTMFNHLYGGSDEPFMKIIDVFVCKLRKKLERAGLPEAITTVWGYGYVLREALVRLPLISTPVDHATAELVS